ncbi:MAG: HAMP domain-containing sensor histidine kinase [Planctomycetota bacterium]
MTRTAWAFAAGSAVVLAALTGISWMLLDLERREEAAREATRSERAVGEALLRMDLVMMPVLAGESARWPEVQPGCTPGLPPAPELPFVRRYFALGPDGLAPRSDAAESALPLEPLWQAARQPDPEVTLDPVPAQNLDTQSFEGRTQIQGNFALNNLNNNRILTLNTTVVPPGPFHATFVPAGASAPRLYFVRLPAAGDERLQGIEADWPALAGWLLEQVRDVLPAAKLRPCIEGEAARRLASLPVALEPGPLPAAPAASQSLPLRVVLGVVWFVVLGALLTAGFALRAANSLAARRALFVSSVTHELRTPLTTFRMYADMLASGMVPEPARADYYATLRTESERLTRIVESVLLFARLEDGRDSAHRVTIGAAGLCARIEPLLRQRCADAGRELTVDAAALGAGTVHVDPQAVEQILHNLVDNACKYAAAGPIRFAARVAGDHLECDVADTGPGIPAADATLLFRPFQRGAAHRGGTTPGLGLGLSIARGLAAALGGELLLHATGSSGTAFRLRLPLADSR